MRYLTLYTYTQQGNCVTLATFVREVEATRPPTTAPDIFSGFSSVDWRPEGPAYSDGECIRGGIVVTLVPTATTVPTTTTVPTITTVTTVTPTITRANPNTRVNSMIPRDIRNISNEPAKVYTNAKYCGIPVCTIAPVSRNDNNDTYCMELHGMVDLCIVPPVGNALDPTARTITPTNVLTSLQPSATDPTLHTKNTVTVPCNLQGDEYVCIVDGSPVQVQAKMKRDSSLHTYYHQNNPPRCLYNISSTHLTVSVHMVCIVEQAVKVHITTNSTEAYSSATNSTSSTTNTALVDESDNVMHTVGVFTCTISGCVTVRQTPTSQNTLFLTAFVEAYTGTLTGELNHYTLATTA